jgi:hypothetical protein
VDGCGLLILLRSKWVRICGSVAQDVWVCVSGCVGVWVRVCGSVASGMWLRDSGCVGVWLRVCGSVAPGLWLRGSGCVAPCLRVCGSVPPGVWVCGSRCVSPWRNSPSHPRARRCCHRPSTFIAIMSAVCRSALVTAGRLECKHRHVELFRRSLGVDRRHLTIVLTRSRLSVVLRAHDRGLTARKKKK